MNGFFKSVKFKVIVCIAAFFMGIGLYSVSKGGEKTFLAEVIGTVLNPVKKVSNAISDKVALVIDLFTDSEAYVEENKKLREDMADLNRRLIDYEKVKAENEDLRKFIGIREESPDIKVSPPCTIIARTANDPYGTFIIDKGSNDGIKLYDPVATSEGLVGIVVSVAKSNATVRTLLSADLAIGALCVESRDTGIIEGSLSYAADGKCKMIYLNKNHKIKKGDLIISSGDSGQFPQGYIIGNVVDTGVEDSGLTAYAVIKPAVDPMSISSVMVITEFDKIEEEKQIPTGNLGEKTTEPPVTTAATAASEQPPAEVPYEAPPADIPQGNVEQDVPEAPDNHEAQESPGDQGDQTGQESGDE